MFDLNKFLYPLVIFYKKVDLLTTYWLINKIILTVNFPVIRLKNVIPVKTGIHKSVVIP
jgi:hypothetical protein